LKQATSDADEQDEAVEVTDDSEGKPVAFVDQPDNQLQLDDKIGINKFSIF